MAKKDCRVGVVRTGGGVSGYRDVGGVNCCELVKTNVMGMRCGGGEEVGLAGFRGGWFVGG